MSAKLNYDQVVELLPAYVLGTLEPDEMLAVDAYLQTDSRLEARLRELEQAAAQLAYAAPHSPLPADAKPQLLARIHADLAQQPAPDSASAHQPVGHVSQPRARLQPVRPDERPARREGWLDGLRRQALGFGALVALLVLGLYVIQLQTRLNAAATQLETTQNAVAAIQLHLGVIASAEQIVRLNGTDTASEVVGNFYITGEEGVIVLKGLTPLPESQTYQLWLVVDGQPISAGLFAAKPNAASVWDVVVSPQMQNFTAVEISMEPAGGSPTLLGPVRVQGSVNQ
ncbi:MAG: anti-sigma factor [Anaerolineae bacterium]|nr:anti-sigma factor [Anaerolineae bacterium]MCI0610849.1 anti-sigma factor [Anaerolineae bacterium]